MDITFLGQASFKLKGKNATVVTDPYDSSIGLKFPKTSADIITISHDHPDHNAASLVEGEPFKVEGPGEYEIKEVKIVGVSSFHDNKGGKERGKNIIFNMKIDGLWLCHLGDLGQSELTNIQTEAIGGVDVLLVPVGGVYTIEVSEAAKIAAELEPKVVIPMHFADPLAERVSGDSNIELEPVDKFLKEMGTEKVERQPKISLKKEHLPEELTVMLLNKVS